MNAATGQLPRQLCPVPAAGLEFDGVRVWPDADDKVSLLVYDEAMHGEMVRRWNYFPDLVATLRTIAGIAGAWSPTHLGECGEHARHALKQVGESVGGDRLPSYEQLRDALCDLLGTNVTAAQIETARAIIIQTRG
jgi:hypothetical protein